MQTSFMHARSTVKLTIGFGAVPVNFPVATLDRGQWAWPATHKYQHHRFGLSVLALRLGLLNLRDFQLNSTTPLPILLPTRKTSC